MCIGEIICRQSWYEQTGSGDVVFSSFSLLANHKQSTAVNHNHWASFMDANF